MTIFFLKLYTLEWRSNIYTVNYKRGNLACLQFNLDNYLKHLCRVTPDICSRVYHAFPEHREQQFMVVRVDTETETESA